MRRGVGLSGEFVAGPDVVLAVRRHLHVHRQHECVEARALRALDERHDDLPVAGKVSLEPGGRARWRARAPSGVSDAPLWILIVFSSAATCASTESPM